MLFLTIYAEAKIFGKDQYVNFELKTSWIYRYQRIIGKITHKKLTLKYYKIDTYLVYIDKAVIVIGDWFSSYHELIIDFALLSPIYFSEFQC